ncbi:MAG TPA: ISLre2 family transposase, partial [Firmicutes bacterium]|nr:ISLre2 family transposase [Bacillota bacterium]
MDVIRLVEAKFLSVAEKILEVLADGVDFVSFEDQLKKELDNLGCDLLKV